MSSDVCNKDLLPTTASGRTLSFLDFTLLWAGMTVNIAGFAIGAQLYPQLAPVSVLWAIFGAYMMVTVLLVLNGDMGIKYGITFAVYMRACYGYKGSWIPGLIRTIPCFFWFGFQTWVGALAIDSVVSMLTGFTCLPLWIILFAAMQIVNAVYGLKAMAKFDLVAIPMLAIVFIAIFLWMLKANDASFVADILHAPAENTYSMAFAIMGIAGGWITMALNSPDLTRQLKIKNIDGQGFVGRNTIPFAGQFLGLVFAGALILIVGLTSSILIGEWNPIDVVAKTFGPDKPIILFICFLTITFAQWSTNTAANLMPPTYILLNSFPKLSYAKATVISGIIGIAIMPWEFCDYLVQFQVFSSSLLGPICGIMLADYYIIRKMVLNVEDLYKSSGQYTYAGGFNPAAIITTLGAFVVGYFVPDYAFFVTFIIGVVGYLILMRCMVMPKYEQNVGREVLLTVEE
ncbi:cytosine permease [Desulfoluna sp.]|uniref:cytosine permease n=1 Tax=Desulfoluna sp. TaxID=2045199 RepID=UPI002632F293|nr:cytosine permease [Desulfoluna sp.]